MPINTEGSGSAANKIILEALMIDNVSAKNELIQAQIEKTRKSTELMTQTQKKQSEEVKKSTSSWTEFRSMYSTVVDVYRAGQQVWDATVGKAQEYDQTIRDVMLSTGASADASSRLVQVVDDAGVSYSTLKTAMKIASKEGIEPNIQSLMMLSDEYLKLAPGVERNQFLLDKFGKSGLEMARVMELGGDALGKMNSEIDGGLVLTQKAIDESEEYRKNIDQLKDSWDGFVVSVGNKVIPVFNDAIEANTKWADAMDEAAEKTGSTNQYVLKHEAALIMEHNASIAAADAVAEHGDKLDGIVTSLDTVTGAVEGLSLTTEEATKINREYLDLVGNVTKEYESQSEKIGDLSSEYEDLLSEKKKLIDEGWWAESEKVQDVNEKIEENREKYLEATDEFELNTKRRILSMLEEQLSLDGLSAQEQDILLAKGLAWGVYSQEAVDATKAAMTEVQRLTDAINTIPSERTFTMSVLVQGADAVGGLGAGFGSEQWSTTNQHASGGSFMIPQSYGNEGFRLGGGDTASGGEKLTITPSGKSGNEDIVQAIYASKIDERLLARYIYEEGLKNIQ